MFCGHFVCKTDLGCYVRRVCSDCAPRQNQRLRAQVGEEAQVTDQDLIGDRNVEVQQITTFGQDVVPIVSVKDAIAKAPLWNKHVDDILVHDVISILKRPVVVSSGRLTPIFNLELAFPDILFSTSGNIRAKLAYFGYYRANVRVKVAFTATPFMSGKYLLWFAPFEGYTNRRISTTLTCRSGYPCVELDIARGSSVELKIPYCAPLSHFNITNGNSYMGKLHLEPITGTLEGTSPSLGAPYTMYAWFEDVEVSMPSSFVETNPLPPPPASPALFAQVGSEEIQIVQKPSISALAGGVATTARLFSGIVPTWSGFLRKVDWVSRSISAAASSVGMNKPAHLADNCLITNVPARGFTNMDGSDAGVVLGAAPDNSLTLPSGLFSTDVDEMDMAHVVKRSTIATFEKNWTTADDVDTVLFSCPVTPGYCPTVGSSIHPTLLAFVSSMFERWTGGIRYRLAVTKTAFHSGRLRITYHPSLFDPNLSTLVHANAYNWVLDLSVSSDIEIVVPYVSNTQWKNVRLGDLSTSNNVDVSSGMLTITVMTPLVVASSLASTRAPFYVWIAAADDFSLAIPSNPRYVPQEFVPADDIVLSAQVWNETSNDASCNTENIDHGQMMFPKSPIDVTLPEQLCIGEKIVNLRQIIKRFCKIASGHSSPYPNIASSDYSFPGPFPTTGSTLVKNTVSIDPAFFGTNAISYTNARSSILGSRLFSDGSVLVVDDAILGANFQSQALLHYLSYIYTFWTGSKRYKFFVGQNTSQFPSSGFLRSPDGSANLINETLGPRPRSQIPLRVYRDPQILNNGTISPVNIFGSGPDTDRVDSRFETVIYPDLDGCAEFTVPYYSQFPISLICQGVTSSNRGSFVSRGLINLSKGFDVEDCIQPFFSYATSDAVLPTYTGRTIEDIGTFTLYEAAGDDFSFGYLVGAPVLVSTRVFP